MPIRAYGQEQPIFF